MSLRPRLRYHRMTVHVRGDAASAAGRSAGGLLWRIRGPVANEPRAEAAARERRLVLRTLAWCPAIGVFALLARQILALRSPTLWFVLTFALLATGVLRYGAYLIDRSNFRKTDGALAALLTLLLIVMNAAAEATAAIVALVPPALVGAAAAARLVARQHARWLAEDLELSWEERAELAGRADSLPFVPIRLVAAYTAAAGVHLAALRVADPPTAGLQSLLALLAVPWALPWAAGRPIAASSRRAWQAVVLWLNYNAHEWYGPQTFQFDPACRRPHVRRIVLWGATMLLATACVTLVTEPPPDVAAAIGRAIGERPPLRRSSATRDRPRAAAGTLDRLTRGEEAYAAQLRTEEERERYRASLRLRRAEERRDAERAERAAETEGWEIALADRAMRILCAVLCPPLLLFTAVACAVDGAAGDARDERCSVGRM